MCLKIFLLCSIIFTMASCGKKDSSSSSRPEQYENVQPMTGNFRSVLKTINPVIPKNNSFGTAVINIVDDKIDIKLNLINSPANVRHIQSIHAIGRCPLAASDKNNDSIIDVQEGMSEYGQILIPLDSDLSSHESGFDYSPSSNSAGAYSYQEDASLASMLADLYAPDANPSDYLIKLRPKDKFNLENKTFVVMGISANIALPTTVASIHELPAEATIPIACGTIVKIPNEAQD